jgi:phosphatidate cytidylyltransferase
MKAFLQHNLVQRAITVVIGAPIVIWVTVEGRPWFDMMALAVAVITAVELHHMARPGVWLNWPTLASILVVIMVSLLIQVSFLAVIGLLVLIGLWYLWVRVNGERAYWQWDYLLAVMGAFYIGIPLGIVLLIRHHDDGLGWTLLLFASNWGTDAFALLGGRLFGKSKLAPRISPGKTVEGALIGFFSGVILGLWVAAGFELPLGIALLAVLLIGGLSIVGDLLESSIKRFFGVKDTSGLLPGHGGFLDRIDGLLLAAPSLYALMLIFL